MENTNHKKEGFSFLDWFLMIASLIVAIFFLLPLYYSISNDVLLTDIVYSIFIVIAGIYVFLKIFKKYSKTKQNIVKDNSLIQDERYEPRKETEQFTNKPVSTENQPTKLDKVVKVSIILSALLVALSVAYYFVYFLPKKEAIRLEQEKNKESTRADCASWAMNKASEQAGGKKYYIDDYDNYFERCLREKGLAN